MFKTIKNDCSAEIVEKKSKFIANAFYVESVEEAEEKIKQINKKYFDARHNCYAYSIFTESGTINKFSDNGEPSRNSRRANAKYSYISKYLQCFNNSYKIFWWNSIRYWRLS